MADEDRQKIIDRANRLMKQSKILRKMSDELVEESQDIKASAKAPKRKTAKRR